MQRQENGRWRAFRNAVGKTIGHNEQIEGYLLARTILCDAL